MKQRTIKSEVSFKGVGLHSGSLVTATFKPAPCNSGISFTRIDLENQPTIKALLENVQSTNRSTTIGIGDAKVSTIEHIMSALTGLGIDNMTVEIDGPEAPIMDGSSAPFLLGLMNCGIEEQNEDKDYFIVKAPVTFKDNKTGSEITALPSDDYELTSMIDFNSSVLGQQAASITNFKNYAKDIAPCRTFVFLHELEYLLAENLIKGGDLDNAIVIVDRDITQQELDELATKLGMPSITIEEQGVLNNIKLKFNNEPARHKLLDLIGDLSLIGKPIKGKIIASKPGHTININFAKYLKSKQEAVDLIDRPDLIDIYQEPVYDANRVRETLPHRFPFLLVDKILQVDENYIVGLKNVTHNEHYFQGHFPGNPVMPGVLQIEAMAQTGGIFALHDIEDPQEYDTYFAKISEAKFKRKVVPGDTLIFILELTSPIRRGICQMRAKAYVGNELASEARLVAKIIKRTNG